MVKAPDCLWFLVPITALFSPLSLIFYFAFRIYCLLIAQYEAHYHLGLAWFFIAIELISIVPSIFLCVSRVFVLRRPKRPQLYVATDHLPNIDILITCVEKDYDTTVNAIRAACETNYPHCRLRVIVLDNRESLRLKHTVSHLTRRYPFLHYTAQEIPIVNCHQTGCLNHGLNFSDTLAEEEWRKPASLIAVLGTDIIVEPNWLRAIIPHFLQDQSLGMAYPRQYFFNIPINDPLNQDLIYHYAVTEIFNDALSAAGCIGSAFIIRRAALEDIGGFSSSSMVEYTTYASQLTGRGWHLAYIDEQLQCGKMSETFDGHVRQRIRWTVERIQMALQLDFPALSRRRRSYTLKQRLVGFVDGATALTNGSVSIILFLSIPLVLLSGYPFVVYSSSWQLKWLLRLVCIWVFADWLHKAVVALFMGHPVAMQWDQRDQWLVPYYAVAFIRVLLLPKRLGGMKASLAYIDTISPKVNERDPITRPTLFGRIRTIFFSQGLYFHFLFIYLCLLGFFFTILRAFFPNLAISSAYGYITPLSKKEKWIFLLTRIGWPPLFWVMSIASCWIPLYYVVNPPDAVDTEEAMWLDEKSGVRRVKREFWGPRKGVWWGRYGHHVGTGLLLYTVPCFVWSWYVQ